MKISVIPARNLTVEQLAAWSEIQATEPAFASPYFRPEFTQAVDAERDDVEVAVMEEAGAPVGFFPFERTRWNAGQPVGGAMSDFQGVICREGLAWNAQELIRACGLSVWDFDHVLASQTAFLPYHSLTVPSPYMDLTEGFDAYRATAHSQTISQVLRKTRKLEREIGPLRFEAATTDAAVFEMLLKWKSEQYRRTNAPDIFTLEWTVALLRRILETHSPDFGGMMTALYAGDQLAAVHLGMRSRDLLHCWFPAYNTELSKYSPGLIVWTELAQRAEELGIRRIDFGRGAGQYKTSLMSGSVQVAEGFVATSPLPRLWRQGARRATAWVRSSPLRGPARMLRRVHSWISF